MVKLPPKIRPGTRTWGGRAAILTFSHDGSMRLEDLPIKKWLKFMGAHVGKRFIMEYF